MVTVDDLVISLTIKETSKLGKLQKRLETITKGGRIFGLGLGSLGNIPADISLIKRQIQWLRPTLLPGKEHPKELRRVAGSIMKDLEDLPKELVDKILTTRPGYYKTLKQEFGVATDEELRENLEASLDQVRETVQDIFEGTSVLPPNKQEEVVHTLHRLISEAMSKREIGLEFWRRINKFTPEEVWKSRLLDVIREAGAEATPEKQLFIVKQKALELPEIQKALGFETKSPKGVQELIDRVNNVLEAGGDITRAVSADIADWNAQKKISDIVESQNNPDKIAERLNEILKTEGKERVKEILEEINKKVIEDSMRGQLQNLFGKEIIKLVSPEKKQELDKIVKSVYKWTGLATANAKQIDIEVDDIKNLIDDLNIKVPQDMSKNFGLELKRIITRTDINQLLMYMSYYKENAIIIGEQIATGVMEYAKGLGLDKFISIVPNIRILEEKYGIMKDLISTYAEDFLNKYESLVSEILENRDLVKKWLEDPESVTSDEREKLFEYLRGVAHRLGVNPNWIDLPEFARKISNEIDNISTIIKDLSSKQGLVLKNLMSQIKPILIGKMDIENYKDIIEQLNTSLEYIKENTGISEEDKTFAIEATLQNIEAMRDRINNLERYTYQSKPEQIRDFLANIVSQAKEHEGDKDALWKTDFIKKMDKLIKSVESYRDMVLSKLDKKFPRVDTEPSKTTGFPEG